MAAPLNHQGPSRLALRLGDDALIHGQRLCEWCSCAPTLEEDLALSNIALDYLGRARMFYSRAGDALGVGEDELAFLRDVREFENMLLVELPRGDFAFTMARQYLLDEYEVLYFDALTGSRDTELAAIARRIVKEVRYHRRHSSEWMLRLGLGTEESRGRLTAALDDLVGYLPELFEMDAAERALVGDGLGVDRSALRAPWQAAVETTLGSAKVELPQSGWAVSGGRAGIHTEHLGHLLSELQFMQRAYPGRQW